MLNRFAPAARQPAATDSLRDAGFDSTVHSTSSSIPNHRRSVSARMTGSSAPNSEGVPPPTNSESIGTGGVQPAVLNHHASSVATLSSHSATGGVGVRFTEKSQ
jgi:hypothetical protein